MGCIAEWVKTVCGNNNLHLIICNTDLIESIEDEEELINEQLQNNVDAFVICPAPGKETKTMLNWLQGERPFILINEDTYAEEPSGYASVKPDNYKIGQMLAERLIQDDEEQLENKKIGVILGKAETEESVDRIAGLKMDWREVVVKFSGSTIMPGETRTPVRLLHLRNRWIIW